ncbi:MAG: heavy metal translocating P-type ATPase, partial [Oscillospiraceae bacterium]
VINDYDNSAASKIIELCYSSSLNKGKTEKFISKFARIYTPTVIILAVLMAIIPPIFGLGTLNDWVMRGLIFLVASCPCALVISIPLSFFAGIGACSKKGVLIKGSQFIETLSKVNAVAFDKTGTLTSGKLEIESIVFSKDVDKDKTLMLLASTEKYSSHPIAQTILNYYKKDDFVSFSDVKEVAGYGICAKSSDGERFICGGTNILDKYGIVLEDEVKANIYFVQGQKIIARIYLKEEISVDGQNIVQKLRKIGINDVVMLTGDNEASALKVASKCGISKTFCSLLPTDKVQKVNELKRTNCVLFVGDGINDAPVLTSADVGVSMGLGSEVANETSDIILVENRISFLPKAISIARHCMNIVYFNIAFAILIKLIVLILGFLGLGTMWMAVFADIGVTIISVINSVRILKVKKK